MRAHGHEASEGDTHSHVFLGIGHERNERKTWAVIVLCTIMMVIEIAGGALFGSLALVADGLHMSTHAGAMLIAALAYTYARRHATDPRFVFGTGKMGDLAGFTSAIVLAMISILIGYEAVARLFAPVSIQFGEAIPIAVLGLAVNVVSAWLLSGHDHPGHDHGHSHGAGLRHGSAADHDHGHDHKHGDHHVHDHDHEHNDDHGRDQGHDHRHDDGHDHEHGHGHEAASSVQPAASAHRDNNIRSAYVHVIADAAVSVLAIIGLLLARAFGWVWMDPVAGIIGALVIANWAFTLIRDTGGILLDMNPDAVMTRRVRELLECDGDRLVDLHLWRLGPGHLGAVVSIVTAEPRDCGYYRNRLQGLKTLSHLTVEVVQKSHRN